MGRPTHVPYVPPVPDPLATPDPPPLVCQTCGALVGDWELHVTWHTGTAVNLQ